MIYKIVLEKVKKLKKNTNKLKIFSLTLIILLIFFTLLQTESVLASKQYKYFNLLQLEKALNKYENIAHNGDWKSISNEQEWQKNDYGENILLLRKRLLLSGDLSKASLTEDQKLFNDTLERAVKKFQRRHGLTVSGIVDEKTLQQLNIPVETRILQIKKNLRRMKNYEGKLPGNYIIVNIPDFKLKVVENEKAVMKMKVITGSTRSPTPVFNRKITYLVLNPTWIIPYNSSIVNILPRIHKDPNYLQENNIKVFKGWGDESVEVSSTSIDWSKVNKNSLQYRFVQIQGPSNPMGLVKFKFPNKYNVYLHGTPKQHLFAKKVRTFSAGCVRIEEPIKLAKYVLRDHIDWPPEKINSFLDSGQRKFINLAQPLPIYMVYWTVWATEDGLVHFRENIYNK